MCIPGIILKSLGLVLFGLVLPHAPMFILLYAVASHAVAKMSFFELILFFLWQLNAMATDQSAIGMTSIYLFSIISHIKDRYTLKRSQKLLLICGVIAGLLAWMVKLKFGVKAAEISFSLMMLAVIMRKALKGIQLSFLHLLSF